MLRSRILNKKQSFTESEVFVCLRVPKITHRVIFYSFDSSESSLRNKSPSYVEFSNLIFFVTDHLINISLIFLGQFQSLKKLLSGRPTNKPYVGKLVEVSK